MAPSCAAGVAGLALATAGVFPQADAAPVPGFNGGFESWSNGKPQGWNPSSLSVAEETAGAISGSAARVSANGGAAYFEHVPLAVQAGSVVSANVQLSGSSSAQAKLVLVFLDDGFVAAPEVIGLPRSGTASFETATLQATAGPSAAFVHVRIAVSGSGELILDNATLDIQQPEPTATPTATVTPTPTSTSETQASPTSVAVATATPTSDGEATATGTASPTRTPTGTRTATPTREPTSTRTPTPRPDVRRSPTQPLATSTPTLRPSSSSGGMLSNGDFEVVADGKPAYWEKFGGTMFASGEAAGGSYAACLESDTSSTKWLYQVVSVDAGSWYAGSVRGRVNGSGNAMIRVSWYASGDASGSQLDQSESNSASGASWTSLSTGPVQAPGEAQSARVRLLVRPAGSVTACFDDAVFVASAAPAATPVPPASPSSTATFPGVASTATRPGATARTTSTPRPGSGSTGTTRSGTATNVLPAGALPAGPLSLRISEFMSDPPQAGRDADFEWVELTNVGTEPLDLAGWQLADATASGVMEPLVVPPGGFVVVAGPSASMPGGVSRAVIQGNQIGNGLGNDGDSLRLIAPDGQVVDEVSYGDNVKVFDPAPSAPDAGQSLGIIDARADPASENWAITLRPSPGEPNQFPPKSSSTTVAGARQRTPETIADSADGDGAPTIEDDADGGSVAPWIVLGGIAGISAGIAGAALLPRVKKLRGRFAKP